MASSVRRQAGRGAAVAVALTVGVSSAMAGGFALREQSAESQGASFAGNGAGTGLSSMYWNPAAAANKTGPGINTESSYSLIIPRAEVTVESVGGPAMGVPAVAGSRPLASSVAAVAHIVAMTVYCLLGAFQFSPALRGRRRWHRTAGRVLIPVGFVAALGAAWLAVFFSGPPDQLPLAMVRLVFASAMLVFVALGTAAVIRRAFVMHGDWMARAYAIGVGNGTQSLVVILWTVPLGEVDAWGETWLVATGTLITALVAEILIQRRAARR